MTVAVKGVLVTLADHASATSLAILSKAAGDTATLPLRYHEAREGLERRRDEQRKMTRAKDSKLTPWTDDEFAAGRLLLNHLIMGGELDETGVPEYMLHGVRFEFARVCIVHKLENLPGQAQAWYTKYHTMVTNFMKKPRPGTTRTTDTGAKLTLVN